VEDIALERYRDAGTLPQVETILASGIFGRSAADVRREQVECVRSEARRVLDGARASRRRLLGALASVLEDLATVRVRKSVVLVSEGFIHEPRDRLLQEAMAVSQRANAAVYFLDVRGLTVGSRPGSLTERTAPARSLSASRDESTGAEILAADTGGYAVQNANDLGDALKRLSREASHHYLLGYHPAAGEAEGVRSIQVDVDRPNLVVRARKGYYVGSPGKPDAKVEAATLGVQLQDALREPFPIGGIPLRLLVLALRPAGDGQVNVTVASEVGVGGLALAQEPDGSLTTTLDAVIAVRHVRPQAN
jgi:hypothetical protein